MPCMACLQEFGQPTNEFATLEFRDDGRYEVCCSRGHNSVTALQQQKFEILFDIGANAIIDGYYREAISSFSSSLERFYEFCIKVFCEKRKISEDVFKKSWKQMSNQSERQLGAFLISWANEFGEPPTLLSTADSGFRNAVIHKGKIPTKDEALKYGNTIMRLISSKIEKIKSLYSPEIQMIIFRHVRDSSVLVNDQVSGGTMGISTIVSLSNGNVKSNRSLEDALTGLIKWREIVTVREGITKPYLG